MVSSNDMTLEATACKIAYLMGRGDLSRDEIADLMTVSMRGEGEISFDLCVHYEMSLAQVPSKACHVV